MAQGDSCPLEVCVAKAAHEHVIQYFLLFCFSFIGCPSVGPGINIIPALIARGTLLEVHRYKPTGNPCLEVQNVVIQRAK